MKILFDNNTPHGLTRLLAGHTIEEARTRGWEELENGGLISAAEQAGFDLIITADKNIRYQQNMTGRKVALVVLGNSQWIMVKQYVEHIIAAVNAATPGSYVEVDIPLQTKNSR